MTTTSECEAPKVFYRYRSLSGKNRDRVKNIFLKGQVYFPSPRQINDPFDCRVNLRFEGISEKRWTDYLKGLAKRKKVGAGRTERRWWVKEVKKSGRYRDPAVRQRITESIQKSGKWGHILICELPWDILGPNLNT